MKCRRCVIRAKYLIVILMIINPQWFLNPVSCFHLWKILSAINMDCDLRHLSLVVCYTSWWRHQMETFSALLALCAGNSPVSGEFPTQRPVTRSFDVFFDLCLNKRLSKQSWCWWFETLSSPLWRHCNVTPSYTPSIQDITTFIRRTLGMSDLTIFYSIQSIWPLLLMGLDT